MCFSGASRLYMATRIYISVSVHEEALAQDKFSRAASMAFAVAKVPYLQFDLQQLSANWNDVIGFKDCLPQRQVYRIRCGGTSFLAAL